jgi:hypothetical protein
MDKTTTRKFRVSIINRETEEILAAHDLVFDLPEEYYEKPQFVQTVLNERERLLRELIKTEVKEIKED